MAHTNFNGCEWTLRQFGGASGSRVSHRARNLIGEHRHDWPNITIHLLGACDEEVDVGLFRLNGPSITVLPARSDHANRVGPYGLETVGLLLDPTWLGAEGASLLPNQPINLRGGAVGLASRRLAAAWMSPVATESTLARSTAGFLRLAINSKERRATDPAWLGEVIDALQVRRPPSSAQLARRLGLHPAWLARAYRQAVGEGLSDTIRRRRVERAAHALRCSVAPLALIAAEAGFCDQPHMNRCFQNGTRANAAGLQRQCGGPSSSHQLSKADGKLTIIKPRNAIARRTV